MSLKCAVQLGIPDIIKKHGRPMALSDLVSALRVNPSKASGVYRLMRLLVHSGFFTSQKVSENCKKWVFHNWSDEDGVKILRGCKEAVLRSKRGKVIIIDMVLETNNKGGKPNQTEPSVPVNDKGDDDKYSSDYTKRQLCFDIVMLTVLPGKERTEKEWASLFAASGFARYKITPTLGLRSLIEVYP
ncbi:hypothetical protein RHSIM_Rhsim04G0072000 [Rhododendron simsii]|uniref:O-methyltransferase n=1 Tax=Rhododendron simsii TaxID=118357 RepID=A0A834H6G2_RHOSS|nr:hypothetical protein RHSIM_Rhsim04G0072000 [Rhododendron simsii]